jgi:rubrerythrin
MASDEQTTGTGDVVYDLVSVLYHSLQGAEIYEEFATDADEAGDQELAQFFRDVQKEERSRADRAKQFLAKRLQA